MFEIKNLAVFHVVGLSQDPKVEGQSSIKSRLRRFSKSPENGFFDPEYGQNDPLRGPNFDQHFDFKFIYRPFELKILLKMWLLGPKTMPEQLLNNSKTTFKKSKKQLFLPQKWSKLPSQRAKI